MEFLNKLSALSFKEDFVKKIILIIFLLGTLFLGVVTWKIQHSCSPMMASSDVRSSECPDPQPKTKPTPRSTPTPTVTHTPEPKTTPTPPPCEPPSPECPDQGKLKCSDARSPGCSEPPDLKPDAIGLLGGSVALGGLAIVETPVVVAVGVGIAVWFILRTAVKAISGH